MTTTNDELKKRITEANEFVGQLAPEVRSQAFALLMGGAPIQPRTVLEEHAPKGGSGGDPTTFFGIRDSTRPSETALLVAAYWYSQYGAAPFSKEWVESTAEHVGLTIPTRVDMTYRGAKRDGKSLFRVKGGEVAFTVHGELWMQRNYDVRKGTKEPPQAEGE